MLQAGPRPMHRALWLPRTSVGFLPRAEFESQSSSTFWVRCVCVCVCVRACWVGSVVSNSLHPLDCSPPGSSVPRDSPGKNTGVGCHALLQGIFPTQGWNPLLSCLLRWQEGQVRDRQMQVSSRNCCVGCCLPDLPASGRVCCGVWGGVGDGRWGWGVVQAAQSLRGKGPHSLECSPPPAHGSRAPCC